MTDDDLNKLAENLWKRMEPFAKVELERLFTNYMSTRLLLDPDLVKKLFNAMDKDMHKFVNHAIQTYRDHEQMDTARKAEQYEKWRKHVESIQPPPYPGTRKWEP